MGGYVEELFDVSVLRSNVDLSVVVLALVVVLLVLVVVLLPSFDKNSSSGITMTVSNITFE